MNKEMSLDVALDIIGTPVARTLQWEEMTNAKTH